ncbi:histidine kinase (plasmid) [Halorientalis sp. IM1011]|uniref:ATP-binding response regulator n=1 Tax=Halorientalis sp. IM1011 TaxID=1932360 RepID=UPI00097CD4BE|nr:ATP-binding protein [Halorientalis sp. IM1011]AQL44638.1 histidine kinase [Halorientalis sp. IM1011]
MTDLTVLLVEDNPGDARFVEELLGEVGARSEDILTEDGTVTIHHETTVGDGVAVLEGDDVTVDVVLQDLHLPDSKGMTTVESILEATSEIPVVVLTGKRDAALAIEAVRAGAQDYLVKDDITADRLAHVIRYAIQRKQTERKLRQRTRQLEIMNQLTRHDIRNDVSLVIGRLHELRELVDDRHDELLTEVLTASNHVLQLTRTIGNTVEAVTDQEETSLDPVPLDSILESEIDQARQLYESAEIRVDSEIPSVEVQANRLLSSVFGNLLSNAMTYNDTEQPLVTVRTTVSEETVTVAIADNGPGIPPRQRERLFSPEQTDLEGSGIGIGLYLVASLVDSYGGEIWVADNDPTGTVVHVELQRA